MFMLEVTYRRPDGTTVHSLATYSYRRGPVGEWVIGDTPLDQIDGEIIDKRPARSGGDIVRDALDRMKG